MFHQNIPVQFKVFLQRFKKTYFGHICLKGTKKGQEKPAPAVGFLGTHFKHLKVKVLIRIIILIVDLVFVDPYKSCAPRGRSASIFISIP